MVREITCLIAGGIIGVISTKKYFENKYEAYANEEIESVKKMYLTKNTEKIKEDEKKKQKSEVKTGREALNKKSVLDYAAIVQKEGYIDYSKEELKEAVDSAVYVITPDEFATEDEYETVSLTFYNDKILANDINGEIIEDVDSIVGIDSLEHFGEYEEDCVYVRNDRLRTDYEILLDERNYSEAFQSKEE